MIRDARAQNQGQASLVLFIFTWTQRIAETLGELSMALWRTQLKETVKAALEVPPLN